MASILDHVVSAVPRATVYGAMRGTGVYVGKYFREINPSSNAIKYSSTGEREINPGEPKQDLILRHEIGLPSLPDK